MIPSNTNVGLRAPGQSWEDIAELGTAGYLGIANSVLYTAPNTANTTTNTVNSRIILIDLWISNTDTSARTFRLHIVANGGSASGANALFYDVSLKASQGVHFSNLWTLIPAGGTIEGLASVASKVNYRMTGRVIQ